MRAGSNCDQVVLRRGSCWGVFGPKVFCTENPPNDPALLSRCIVVSMTECDTSKLKKPSDLEIAELSQEVQNQLLAFRLDMLNKVHPATVPGSEGLAPRRRDLLSALAAPFAEDPDWPDLLLECLENTGHAWPPSLSPFDAAIQDGLWAVCHTRPGYQCVYSLELTNLIIKLYKQAGQKIPINAIITGKSLAKSGIQLGPHTRSGNGFWLNDHNRRIIHERVRTYGLTLPAELLVGNSAIPCKFCESPPVDSSMPFDDDLSEAEE